MKSFEERTEEDPTILETSHGSASQNRYRRVLLTAATALLLTVSVGGNRASQGHQTESVETKESADIGEDLRDPETLHRAEQIISTFENSTTEIQYDYVENIKDGRGITAGRAGFTSETSDLLYVVQTYVDMGGDGQLAGFVDELKVASETPDVVEEISGFEAAWKEAIAKDDILKNAQDKVYHEWYLDPALKRADKIGIKTALGQTIILDTIIQMGEGEDVDGLPSIIAETIEKVGTPEGQEEAWLHAFLDIRQHHLENAADPETRDGWRDSVPRVEALRSILDKRNLSLTPPLEWKSYGGEEFSITE